MSERDRIKQPGSPAAAGHRRRGMALRLAVTGVAAVVVLGGGSWLGIKAAGGKGAKAPGVVELYTVAKTSFDISTTSSGELEAKNQTEIRNPLQTQTTILEVVKEGTSVKKGDLLVKLNAEQITKQVSEAELRVITARSDLEAAESAFSISQKDRESKMQAASVKLELAELSLRQWEEGEQVQKSRDNGHAIKKATEELQRLKEKYELSIKLNEQGFLSKDALKQDKLAYEQAQRDLEKAELSKEIFEKYEVPKDKASRQSDLDQARAEKDRVEEQTRIELKSKDAAKQMRQESLRHVEDDLKKLKEQEAAATITAPQDGLVVYATSIGRGDFMIFNGNGPLAVGRQCWPNETLIVLPDTSKMVATVRVHESLASKIKPGQSASVKIDAVGGRTLTGVVDSIGVLSESAGWRDPNLREYTVKIMLDPVAGVELKPSMRCEAEIVMGRVEEATAAPIQAVFNEGMLKYMCVPSGGKYVKRAVKLGRRSDRFAEIVAGVDAGERVLLREPAAGEVAEKTWTGEELAAVGLKLDVQGQIVMASTPEEKTAAAPDQSPKAIIGPPAPTDAAEAAEAAKADTPAEGEAASPGSETPKESGAKAGEPAAGAGSAKGAEDKSTPVTQAAKAKKGP